MSKKSEMKDILPKTGVMEKEEMPGYKKTKLGWIPEDWEFIEFDQVAEKTKTRVNPQTSDKNYRCIELEHINQGLGSINGNVNSKDQRSIKNFFSEGEVLFGKLRPYLKKYWISNFEGVCSSEIWVLRPKNNKLYNKYLFYIVQQHRFIQISNVTSGSKMPRADWDYVGKYPFLVPPIKEQIEISNTISSWDKAIDQLDQLIQQKELLKKALMQQLLTGQKRLPGFSEEWKELKLEELFKERNEKGHHSLTLLSIGEAGVYPQSKSNKKDTSNTDKSKYKRICPGDIGYNTMRLWQGRNALSHLEGIISPAYTVVTPKSNAHGEYFKYLFKLPALIHKFYRNSQGLVSDTLNCKFKDFKIVKVLLPPTVKEQNAIARILLAADMEIELIKEKKEMLENQKKGLMQQLLTGKMRINQ